MIDDESLVKTRTNTCLSYASAIPSYSVLLGSFSSDYECEYEYEIRQAKSMLYAYAIPY